MKTGIDIVDNVYSLVDVSEVKDSITGDVYADRRPDGSGKEDVVINSLPITGTQLQTGIVNVNIHVPNLKLTIDEQPDNSHPNRKKLKEVSDKVILILKDALINNMVTGIENISLIPEPDLKEHFMNIRVRINSINI